MYAQVPQASVVSRQQLQETHQAHAIQAHLQNQQSAPCEARLLRRSLTRVPIMVLNGRVRFGRNMMKRILFVDDDVSVLDALSVRLRPMRDRWSMTFVPNGAEALLKLQRDHYDLMVSDIRMPGMDGARLLRVVSERWPQTVRLALSGCTDHRATHLVPIAHQFLVKPCPPHVLEYAIEHCLALQDLLHDLGLRALVGRIHRLPPIRRTYRRLQALLENDTAATHEVAELISSDTVTTAKLLQTVNSAFYPLGRQMIEVKEAVDALGLTRVRELVSSPEVFAQWPPKSAAVVLDLERLQLHADAVARVARRLTMETSLATDTVAAARLHNIGYWILAQERPRELANALEFAQASNLPMHEAERQVIGASHAEIGAYLLGLWGLPTSIIQAIAEHHTRVRTPERDFDVSAALIVAIALSGGDEADTFRGVPRPSDTIGPECLESMRAPFTWGEALRRARAPAK